MIALTTSIASAQTSTPTSPATIQDPLLRKGWSLLNQQTEPVQLWDGQVVSGHELAQYVLDHAVPIVWDVDNICDGGSCSLRCFNSGDCTQSQGKTSAHPIYMSLALMVKKDNQWVTLVDNLAHEIYHYTLPYGAVDDTLYEEFSAYYVGMHIASNLWSNIKDYLPLRPACLEKWFYDTRLLEGYQHLHAYPQSVLPSVDASSPACSQLSESSQTITSDNSLTCSINKSGSVSCRFPPSPTPAPEYRVECKDYPDGSYGCETIWLTEEPSNQATPDAPKK